jgi:hypothetical protein
MGQRGQAPIGVASTGLVLGSQDSLEVVGRVALIPVIGEEPDAVPGNELTAGRDERSDDVFRFVCAGVFDAVSPAATSAEMAGASDGTYISIPWQQTTSNRPSWLWSSENRSPRQS